MQPWAGTQVAKVLPTPHQTEQGGDIVLVGTTDPSDDPAKNFTNARHGLWISKDGGESIEQISGKLGLPLGAATDIVMDPVMEMDVLSRFERPIMSPFAGRAFMRASSISRVRIRRLGEYFPRAVAVGGVPRTDVRTNVIGRA